MAGIKSKERKKSKPYDVMKDPRIIELCLTCPKKRCLSEKCNRFIQGRREILKNG